MSLESKSICQAMIASWDCYISWLSFKLSFFLSRNDDVDPTPHQKSQDILQPDKRSEFFLSSAHSLINMICVHMFHVP